MALIVLRAGYFAARAYSSDASTLESDVCIDNAKQAVVDASNCATETPWFSATSSAPFDLKTYLALTDQDVTDLAGYIALLNTGTVLPAAEVPTNARVSVKNFPDLLEIIP